MRHLASHMRLSCKAAIVKLISIFLTIEVSYCIPCGRYLPGSFIREPAHYYSKAGRLNITLFYETTIDSTGFEEHCLSTASGERSPTLHLIPGGRLTLTLVNLMQDSQSVDLHLNTAATNLHFHGMHVSPLKNHDNTFIEIDGGGSFTYELNVPPLHPPGLYWYHSHFHGSAERAVLGGATGLIIVDGIEKVANLVAGLPTRTLTFRDEEVSAVQVGEEPPPTWELSMNFIPVHYPEYEPARISMAAGSQEFWRVAHTGADSALNLQVVYDGVPQVLQVVALDGFVVDGPGIGRYIEKTNIFLSPASRAEFIVKAPDLSVENATLIALKIPTGNVVNIPQRTVASIFTALDSPGPALKMPRKIVPARPLGHIPGGVMAHLIPDRVRALYFSQIVPSEGPSSYFITVEGQEPQEYSKQKGPAIVTRQGSMEDWIITNRALTPHVFHIHQVHFLLLEVDGVPVQDLDRQFYDTIRIAPWDGEGAYPSIRVRMDFSVIDVGIFPYHCHILNHEDNGMMALIQVVPGFVRKAQLSAEGHGEASETDSGTSSDLHAGTSLWLVGTCFGAAAGVIAGFVKIRTLVAAANMKNEKSMASHGDQTCTTVICSQHHEGSQGLAPMGVQA